MASEDIGALFNTKIPGYDDPADIQDALKLFLYGSTTYDETNTDPNNLLTPSLAKHLQTIKDRAELGTGSDYLTETEVENLTPTDGYIWVDVNSTGNGHPIYATAVYTNEAPTTGLADGIIWVDKDASPQRAYIYDAGSSSWVLINELLNIIDASGDLVYGIGADTVARLPIGSVGKVLKVSSSNLPAWEDDSSYSLPSQSGNAGKFLTTNGSTESWGTPSGGGTTLITDVQLSSSTGYDFSSIPGTYKNLVLTFSGLNIAALSTNFGLRFNNNANAVYENYTQYQESPASAPTSYSSLDTVVNDTFFGNQTTSGNQYQSARGSITIYDYASTNRTKFYSAQVAHYSNNNGRTNFINIIGNFNSTTPITSLNIVRFTGTSTITNAANTSIRLYGVS
jgi:hypothetical protein